MAFGLFLGILIGFISGLGCSLLVWKVVFATFTIGSDEE